MSRINLYNAKATTRVISFIVDCFFANIIRTITQVIFITKENLQEYRKAIQQFKNIFPNFRIVYIEDYHVFYFTSTAPIYNTILKITITVLFSGIVYNILSYLCLNKRTLGQRLMGIKVVNINDDETPSFYKLLLKSILTPLPFIMTTVVVFCSIINIFGIHGIMLSNTIFLKIIKMGASFFNPLVAGFVVFCFVMFWFNIYFLTDKLILGDILSRTRVVDKEQIFKTIIVENNGKQEIRVETKSEKSFIVAFGDKAIEKIEKFNEFLKRKNKQIIKYLKDKITKR
jgi:uncharacterized RDD family membrane protein YckC